MSRAKVIEGIAWHRNGSDGTPFHTAVVRAGARRYHLVFAVEDMAADKPKFLKAADGTSLAFCHNLDLLNKGDVRRHVASYRGTDEVLRHWVALQNAWKAQTEADDRLAETLAAGA